MRLAYDDAESVLRAAPTDPGRLRAAFRRIAEILAPLAVT
jgi:hypothetical protein